MNKTISTPAAARAISIGMLVLRIAAIAWRARRPLLLVGQPGVGKSELLLQLGKMLGIRIIVIDLSLCEPADLVGLPRHEDGRTRFSPPSWLPTDGEGMIVFEELNRAERYIQGPVLQLLTARRLNDYELPPGWSCAGAINPDDGQNDVRALDPAMLTRFVVVPVCADRREWLGWARCNGVHPAILHVVGADPASFEQVSPRSWKYASELLVAMTAEERGDAELLHQTLAGVLPESWVVVVGNALARLRGGDLVAVDLLRTGRADEALLQRLVDLRDQGRTDVLRAIASDLAEILASPIDLPRLCAQHEFALENLERVLELLPGDMRAPLQEALAQNQAAHALLEIDFADLLQNGYQGRGYDWKVCEWQREQLLHHRARLFVNALCAHLRNDANLPALRRATIGRRALGRILGDLRPEFRDPLLDSLARLNVEPILADRRS